jgi:hypothetical protein
VCCSPRPRSPASRSRTSAAPQHLSGLDDHRDRQRDGRRDARPGVVRLRRDDERRNGRRSAEPQRIRGARHHRRAEEGRHRLLRHPDDQVSLWPQTSSNGTEITGYQASNSVHVTAALGDSGELVDAAVRAGANNVEGPSLDTADKSSIYNQALKQALGDARSKAQAIADGAGLTLGSVVRVREGGTAPVPMPMFDTANGRQVGADRSGNAAHRGVGEGDVLGELELTGAVARGHAIQCPTVRGEDDLLRQEVGTVARMLLRHLDDDLVDRRFDGSRELVPHLRHDRERR